MTITAIDFVREPRGGGPKTEAGKARSSRNAVMHGLYNARDFILPGEEEEYTHNLNSLWAEVSPEGFLEENFATEILGATWRLRRCRLVEWELSSAGVPDFTPLDPMVDEATAKQQKSVDRARAQSHNVLRRSISELSRLQTERTIRLALEAGKDLGLTSLKQVFSTMKMHDKEAAKEAAREESKEQTKDQNAEGLAAMETLMALADKQLCQELRQSKMDSDLIRSETASAAAKPVVESSFCKPAAAAPAAASSFCKPAKSDLIRSESRAQTTTSGQKVPRNALCPCGSGKKYKRCCLNPVKPATKPDLDKAA